MQIDNIQKLPVEMIERILRFCPVEEQLQYERVCTCFAEALSDATPFLELRLYKDAIVVLKQQRQRLKGMKLLSQSNVIWLTAINNTASKLKFYFLQSFVGVPVNSLLRHIPVVNCLYYPYEFFGLGGLWYSFDMLPAYAALSYVSLATEVACTHLLATNQHVESEKKTLSEEFIAQQEFLTNYWAKFNVSN